MQTQQKTYLKFIEFKNLVLWDVKRYSQKQISSHFPMVSLGNYIQAENEKHRKENKLWESVGKKEDTKLLTMKSVE